MYLLVGSLVQFVVLSLAYDEDFVKSTSSILTEFGTGVQNHKIEQRLTFEGQRSNFTDKTEIRSNLRKRAGWIAQKLQLQFPRQAEDLYKLVTFWSLRSNVKLAEQPYIKS